jgi:hypothetical protein
MDEFTIGSQKFKLNRINAMIQFHIVRRIGPLLADLMSTMAQISKKNVDALSEDEKLQEFSLIAEPVMRGLSRLSDQDSEYVLYRLLAAVEIHQPQFNVWSVVAKADTGILFQDLEMPVLLQLAGRSLMYNLKGFFSLLPHKGSGQ